VSNELKITLSIRATKGELDWRPPIGTMNVDMANGRRGGFVQTVGTTEEAIGGLTDLTTFGWAWIKNLDTTNYVEIGPDSGGTAGTMVSMMKLLAGEYALFPVTPGITLKARANTAAVDLDVNVLER